MPQFATLRNHLIFLVGAGVLFVIALIVYIAQGNSYAPEAPPASSFRPPITNAYLLQDQMPDSVYRYTIARIDDYLQSNNLIVTTMHIDSGVAPGIATYDFILGTAPQGQALQLNVDVANNDGFTSTNVTIDGQSQAPLVPGSVNISGNSTSYSGFSTLIDKGLAAIQANELGQAFTTFAPGANSFAIDEDSVSTYLPPADQSTNDVTYTFSVKVDDTTYSAKLTAIGLYQSRLLVTNPTTHKQVYDSGVLDQGA